MFSGVKNIPIKFPKSKRLHFKITLLLLIIINKDDTQKHGIK